MKELIFILIFVVVLFGGLFLLVTINYEIRKVLESAGNLNSPDLWSGSVFEQKVSSSNSVNI